jgi:excisionase family DNA binding protein
MTDDRASFPAPPSSVDATVAQTAAATTGRTTPPTTERDALRLLKIRDAADALGVGEDQLRRWLDDGTLPYVLVGVDRRVSQLMLAEWQRWLVDAARDRVRAAPRPVTRRRATA